MGKPRGECGRLWPLSLCKILLSVWQTASNVPSWIHEYDEDILLATPWWPDIGMCLRTEINPVPHVQDSEPTSDHWCQFKYWAKADLSAENCLRSKDLAGPELDHVWVSGVGATANHVDIKSSLRNWIPDTFSEMREAFTSWLTTLSCRRLARSH